MWWGLNDEKEGENEDKEGGWDGWAGWARPRINETRGEVDGRH